MLAARGQMLIAARAAGIQCFDTVFSGIRMDVIASQSALLWGSFIIGVPKGMRIATSGFALLIISPKKTTERKKLEKPSATWYSILVRKAF